MHRNDWVCMVKLVFQNFLAKLGSVKYEQEEIIRKRLLLDNAAGYSLMHSIPNNVKKRHARKREESKTWKISLNI